MPEYTYVPLYSVMNCKHDLRKAKYLEAEKDGRLFEVLCSGHLLEIIPLRGGWEGHQKFKYHVTSSPSAGDYEETRPNLTEVRAGE